MSNLLMCGFEWTVPEPGISFGPEATASVTHARSGTYGLCSSVAGDTWTAYTCTFSNCTEIFFQTCHYVSGGWISTPCLFFRWGNVGTGSNMGSISLLPGNFLGIRVPSGTTKATGTTVLLVNVWYVIEVHIVLDSISGLVEARLDGNPEVSWTGNTKPTADTTVSYIQHFTPGYTSYVDDVILNDTSGSFNNSWPGGLQVIRLAPTADGTYQQWTPTPAGLTHYTAVDEVPPSGTDYLSTNQVGILDTYPFTALPAGICTTGNLIVRVDALAKKDSVGSSAGLKHSLKVGSTVYSSVTSTLLAATYSPTSTIWDSNPAGLTWTAADINSLEAGVLTSG